MRACQQNNPTLEEVANIGLAENLTRIQAEHGETNYRLAKEIGVCQTSIKNWKTGERKPHPRNVVLLEKHYKLKSGTLQMEV